MKLTLREGQFNTAFQLSLLSYLCNSVSVCADDCAPPIDAAPARRGNGLQRIGIRYLERATLRPAACSEPVERRVCRMLINSTKVAHPRARTDHVHTATSLGPDIAHHRAHDAGYQLPRLVMRDQKKSPTCMPVSCSKLALVAA